MNYFYQKKKKKKKRIIFKIFKKLIAIFETVEIKVRNWIKNKKNRRRRDKRKTRIERNSDL
jgi:hypothetical protein